MLYRYQNQLFLNAYISTKKKLVGRGLLDDEKSFNKSTQAILILAKLLSGANRSVTFDKWFTSVDLVQEMQQRT